MARLAGRALLPRHLFEEHGTAIAWIAAQGLEVWK